MKQNPLVPRRVVLTKNVNYNDGAGYRHTVHAGTVAYVGHVGESFAHTVSPYTFQRIIEENHLQITVPEDCVSIGVDSLWHDEYEFQKLPLTSFNLKSRYTDVILHNDATKGLDVFLTSRNMTKRIAIITDDIVNILHAQEIFNALTSRGISVNKYVFAHGEENKFGATCLGLMERMASDNYDKHATILAVGGGVVGDIAAFVASTYHRGVDYLVHIPTTLMAAVDSAHGGKTGFNLGAGKNLVGTFRPANLIVIDPFLLRSLDSRTWYSGVAEIIKYGAIMSPDLFNRTKRPVFTDHADLIDIMGECITLKNDVVERDPREQNGIREVLNFGHTFGHALETVTGYTKYTHGEAVGLGMLVAIQVSGLPFNVDGYEQIRKALKANQLPTSLSRHIDVDQLVRAMTKDKKIGKWVLLKAFGETYTSYVADAKIRGAIENLQNDYSVLKTEQTDERN